MKFLYVSHKDITHPKSGGAEVYADIFLQHIARAGHKVDIITSRFSNQNALEHRGNVRIFRYKGYFGPHLALPVFLVFGNYDLVITDLGHVVPWPSTVFYGNKTINIFYHLHKRTLQGQVSILGRVVLSLLEHIYPYMYKKCFFVTISTTSRSDLVSLGINRDRILIIPPGVDTASFVPREKSLHPQMIFFSGLRDYKRPELALEVLRILVRKYPNFQLLIAGDGPAKKRLEERTSIYGLQSNVHFLGRVDRPTLIRCIAESCVNIQFSVSEGFGITIIEASACGTPTVAFRVPGVVDAIVDSENGFLVEDGDLQTFTERVEYISRDPYQWREKCLEVANHFPSEQEGRSWLNLVENVTERTP